MSNRRKSFDFVMVSETYTADLKGRQSVRTTFKLPTRCIDALSLLAGQLGIKCDHDRLYPWLQPAFVLGWVDDDFTLFRTLGHIAVWKSR